MMTSQTMCQYNVGRYIYSTYMDITSVDIRIMTVGMNIKALGLNIKSAGLEIRIDVTEQYVFTDRPDRIAFSLSVVTT